MYPTHHNLLSLFLFFFPYASLSLALSLSLSLPPNLWPLQTNNENPNSPPRIPDPTTRLPYYTRCERTAEGDAGPTAKQVNGHGAWRVPTRKQNDFKQEFPVSIKNSKSTLVPCPD